MDGGEGEGGVSWLYWFWAGWRLGRVWEGAIHTMAGQGGFSGVGIRENRLQSVMGDTKALG
jgi:hypothetical protein